MQKNVDMVGKKFGKLLVLRMSGNSKKGIWWNCNCDCGNTKDIYGGHLRSGGTKSCGCEKNKPKDILGMKFGKLLVIKFLYMRQDNAYWMCLCDCGSDIVIPAFNLKSGNTRSCGCSSKEFYEETCLKIYGTKSSFQNEEVKKKFRETNLVKYGVEYPAQNHEIALKTARSSKNVYILKHWKTGEELVCQAGWEKKVVEYLNLNMINFRWQPRTFKVVVDNKMRTYRPDLYIFSIKKWVEIKGYKRVNAMKKWQYFKEFLKPNSELWDKAVLEAKGIL